MVKIETLTVKEVAQLKGCSEQYIKKIITQGKLAAIEQLNEVNRQKQYFIEVSSLPEDLQLKYYRQSNADVQAIFEPEPTFKYARKKEVYDKPLESYSELEREIISIWFEIIERWQFERQGKEKATEFDSEFIENIKLEYKKYFEFKFNKKFALTSSTLYRKWQCVKVKDYDGLIGRRGGSTKGETSVPDKVFSAFLYYYFDLNQPSVAQCYRTSIEWTRMFYPSLLDDLPSERAFRRRLQKDVPKAIEILMRKGNKAFNDEALVYIEREYKSIESNDCWIADNHTIDVISRHDGTEKKHRIYVTAFQDAKSGMIVGWNVTETPNSNSTLIALRHGIMRCGKPKLVYFDNGSEFLTNDIAGRGHRRRSGTDLIEKPPAILKKLDIEMRNALVKNAQAKPVERFFLTFKEQFSKMYDAYTGGHAKERPENHAKIMKDLNRVPTDADIKEHVELFMDGLYNVSEYGGKERNYKGMTRVEVFNQSIKKVGMIKVKEDDLNLLLMRNKGYQKISRNGVYLPFYNERIWYRDNNTILHLGTEVCVRYNPSDIRTVRVYDKEDRFLFELPMVTNTTIAFSEKDIEAVKTAVREKARVKKMAKEVANEFTEELSSEEKIDMLTLQIMRMHRGLDVFEIEEPDEIEYFDYTEKSQYMLYKDNELKNIGNVEINIDAMNKRGVS